MSKVQTTAAMVLSVALIGGFGMFTYRALAAGPGDESSRVTRADESARKVNGNDKSDEAEKDRVKAEKPEDQRLKALLDDTSKLQIENEVLKERVKKLQDDLARARPSQSTTPPPWEKARSETSSAVSPAEKQDARDTVEIMEAQLQVKKAELQGAMVDLQAAQRNRTRVNALAKSRAISNEEVQAAEDKLARQKAAVQVKEAELQEQEVRLRQATRRLDQLGSGTGAQRTPARATYRQQLQEIRKILKELERKIDSLEKTAGAPAPAGTRR